MCGRFTLTDPDPRVLRMRFAIDESVDIAEEKPRYNIAPTDPILAVRRTEEGKRDLGRLRWGLIPHFASAKTFGALLINARAETLEKVPAFRDAYRERRCLIPADGFYEWADTPEGKRPVWISQPGEELFAFAGIWAAARDRDGEELHSCAIVTCDASEAIRPIHDRMPVVLPHEAEAAWLEPDADPTDLGRLLRPAEDLELRQVSTAVNDVHDDGPHLLEPPAEPLKLF